MEMQYDRCCEALTENHKPINGLDSSEFAFRFRAEQKRALQHDQLVSALTVSDTVDFDEIAADVAALFGRKSPVSVLMEHAQYTRSKVNFVEVGEPDGPQHKPVFTLVAVVGGCPYTRVKAGSKKDCRSGAAYLAWKAIIHNQQEQYQRMLFKPSTTEHDKMAALSYREYLLQVETNPTAFSGRRVLAAILMKSANSDVTVLSLGTGSRCILSSYLNLDGMAVNDSHAEVIARRAFIKYLYHEVSAFRTGNNDCILEHPASGINGLLRVKFGTTFHLYVSAPPCGDASLFSREFDRISENFQSTESEVNWLRKEMKPIYSSNVQGLLRTKIEAGEGSIPVEQNKFQTWIGLQFGNRLRTMCCSDKILKWNVVGLQGALLSHLIEPIYLSSISVGDPYVRGHIARALYDRLQVSDANPLVLPKGFRINCPVIGHTVVGRMVQETEKSTAVTMSWFRGAPRVDVIDGTAGHLLDEHAQDTTRYSALPLVCKKLLYADFKQLCHKLHCVVGTTYYEAKQSARSYQEAKTKLYRSISAQGYGDWIKKPVEIDYFY